MAIEVVVIFVIYLHFISLLLVELPSLHAYKYVKISHLTSYIIVGPVFTYVHYVTKYVHKHCHNMIICLAVNAV